MDSEADKRDLDLEARTGAREQSAVASSRPMEKRQTRSEVSDPAKARWIVSLKQSKAGYLGALAELYDSIEDKLLHYDNVKEVCELEAQLLQAWSSYVGAHDELMSVMDDDGAQKKIAICHQKNVVTYREYVRSIEGYLTDAEEHKRQMTGMDKGPPTQMPVIPPVISRGSTAEDAASIKSETEGSSVGSRVARDDARLERILAEKRIEQIKRAASRNLREEELKQQKALADAEDAVEMARTREDYLDKLLSQQEGSEYTRGLQGPQAAMGRDLGSRERQDRYEQRPRQEHEGAVPYHMAGGAAGGVTVPMEHVERPMLARKQRPPVDHEESFQFPSPRRAHDTATREQAYPPVHSTPSFRNEAEMSGFIRSMDQLAVKTSLPPMEVVRYSGDPCMYYQFKVRFHEMVGAHDLSEMQKMSRLLQFVEGKARRAVAGLEGIPGGYSRALKILEQRFGQPHVVAKACVDALIDGPNISPNDREGLCSYADKARTVYETLASMNALSEMNLMVLGKMSRRLPIYLQARWRDKAQVIREQGRLPNVGDIVQFIERTADALNDPVFGMISEVSRSTKPYTKPPRRMPNTGARTTTLATEVVKRNQERGRRTADESDSTELKQQGQCMDCGGSHSLSQCPQFQAKSLKQREAIVRGKGLCFNCLKKGHYLRDCRAEHQCRTCHRKHHTLLHRTRSPENEHQMEKEQSVEAATVNSVSSFEPRTTVNRHGESQRMKVALPVVTVKVCTQNGALYTYALLDTGSEESFITKAVADKLRMKMKGYETLEICTVTGNSTVRVGRVDVTLEPVECNEGRQVHIQDMKVVENLRIHTSQPTDVSRWPHLQDITIPEVEAREVSILIGANVPEVQVHEEYRVGRRGEPWAVRTIFGWTILGSLGNESGNTSNRVNMNFLQYGDETLDQQMRQFLAIDNAGMAGGSRLGRSIEDERALKKLESSIRLVDDKYEVGMLWKHDKPWLPDNKPMAEARLRGLRRKLTKDEDMHRMYTKCMEELLEKGFARKMTNEESARRSRKTWYLPHHGVFHPQKPKKMRIVFDAAAVHEGVSLNSQLQQGPDLTNSLLGVLLRFRQEQVAVVGDIEAMFMQVKTLPDDSDAFRFLWWEAGELSRQPQEYQMLRHIFGATDSPSCCSYSLRRTVEDHQAGISPETVKTLKKDFYVDDLLTSVKSVGAAVHLIKGATKILAKGGFRIRGWMSNRKEVLATVSEKDRADPTLDLDLDELPLERALGVRWHVGEDVFLFRVVPPGKPATKRGVLSTMSSLYDPLGFVCPVGLEAKKLMQRLWQRQLGWDDPLPVEERPKWEKWKLELAELEQLKVSRCYRKTQEEVRETSLHLFADASTEGYGMCAYLRFVSVSGLIWCSFVIGRSRCAPVKPTTIPRLELQAAVLATRIYETIRDELEIRTDKVTFWTDSQTTLQYITNETKRFNVYVTNRVAQIREVSDPTQWRHCPGVVNPADDASRGLTPKKLISRRRWWNGPGFLSHLEDQWPTTEVGGLPDEDPEVRSGLQVLQATTQTEVEENIKGLTRMCQYFSSWNQLQRSVGWLIRFGKWIKSRRKLEQKGRLSLEELDQATLVITRTVQKECFAKEIANCRIGKPVLKSSRLRNLRPVLVEGVLRVGGRLQEAPVLTFEEKHPIILPRNHHVSDLVTRHCHKTLAHAGREQTVAETRKGFWIIGGRGLAKKTVRKCITCRRLNATPMEQVMAPLPESRLVAYRPPFTNTGVDLFGPLMVKWGRGTAKRWGCLFTCLTTRAVYLEVVPSLSTDDFIMVLRQFVARRGPVEEMRSDRGSNFVGCSKELKESMEQWNQGRVERELQQKGVKWIFHPPTAAHMSGVWERLVKSTKRHVKAVVGDRLLSDLALRTLLAEVESVLNSRPISQTSDDPRDLEALTPNHFLMQRKAIGLPPGMFVKEDCFGRKQWRKVQYLAGLFWNRWVKEYMMSLQESSKWRRQRENLRPGDLVLVAEDKYVRSRWPLARVLQVFPGRDGKVRSAKVKTASGEFHRPITRLCSLETRDVCENS